MIATPRKKIAKPAEPHQPNRASSRLRAWTSSSIDMLPNECEDIERRSATATAPASISSSARDSPSPRRCRVAPAAAAIAMSKLVSPTTMRRLGRRAGIGDRLLDHRRVRLGRVAVGGLQRDEARVDAVLLEAMLEAAVRLAGRDGEQPAVGLERVEQFEHAVEQRLLDLARGAQPLEGALVVLGERDDAARPTHRAAAPPWLRSG